MFWYCCTNVLEKDVNELKIRVDTQNKQINNIYELLETLTNESKARFNYLNESNNVSQKDNGEQTATTYTI